MRSARRREIWALALPILGAMVSQTLLNIVDLAFVGHLGAAAVAAVGAASFLHFTAFSAITGLSSAVQAMAARRHGEGRADETALPLNGGIVLSLQLGLPLSLILILAAPSILASLYADPAVSAQGTAYLQLRLAGIAAVGINFSFRGYWSAVRQTRLYLFVLMGMCTLNILLDWLLILGPFGLPALGTRGAGLANLISALAGKKIPEMWTTHRVKPVNGEDIINVDLHFREPGGGLKTTPAEDDEDEKPKAKAKARR